MTASPLPLDWLAEFLPEGGATVVDIGAAIGERAAWFASRGHDVLAVEPSATNRADGAARHPHSAIRWIDDRLPELSVVSKAGALADLVHLGDLWNQVPASSRDRTFRKAAGLLRPGGVLAFVLRDGTADEDGLAKIEKLARGQGLFSVKTKKLEDNSTGRLSVAVAFRLPDDGTGALPTIRNIILNDRKAATYKLALLRSLCRIADGSAGIATERPDGDFEVPLGLVALNWVRQYLPLVAHRLPQTPPSQASNPRGLGFVRSGFRGLVSAGQAPSDLRIGSQFGGAAARDLHDALRNSADTIERMPATYITWPDGRRIFTVAKGRAGNAAAGIVTSDYLRSFGTFRVPRLIWQAMRRHSGWIEPTLVAEWARIIEAYCEGAGQTQEPVRIERLLQWPDPDRDTRLARQSAERLMSERRLLCAWTGRLLSPKTLHIDHMFPISRWPCSDLWNLVPAHKDTNLSKGDRVPSARTLLEARTALNDWWSKAYIGDGSSIADRFYDEAIVTLPAVGRRTSDAVFDAVAVQRIRLHRDQQIPEWNVGQRGA